VVERSQNPVVERSRNPVVERSRNPVVERSRNPVVERSRNPVVERSQNPVVERSRNHCILCIPHVLLNSSSYASTYPLPINSCKIGTILLEDIEGMLRRCLGDVERSFKPRKARKARKLPDEEFRVFSVFRG
jgi:hypothetical protein